MKVTKCIFDILSIHEKNFYIQDPNDINMYIQLISNSKINFIINSYGIINASYYNELINDYKQYNTEISNIFIIYESEFTGHPYEYTDNPYYHKPIKYILKTIKFDSDEIQKKYPEIGHQITKEDINKLTVKAKQLFTINIQDSNNWTYIRSKHINLFI
jgi:hypothetical protein